MKQVLEITLALSCEDEGAGGGWRHHRDHRRGQAQDPVSGGRGKTNLRAELIRAN